MLISQPVMTLLDVAAQAQHLGDIEFKDIAKPVPAYVVDALL